MPTFIIYRCPPLTFSVYVCIAISMQTNNHRMKLYWMHLNVLLHLTTLKYYYHFLASWLRSSLNMIVVL